MTSGPRAPALREAARLALTVDGSRWGELGALLQRGVGVPVREGATVQAFLTEQLGVDPDYVRERVSTVFLDGWVVDSLERAVLHHGSSLALSAAMPGLVGATFRKGGFYSALRAGISLQDGGDGRGAGAGEEGIVRVKLFNLLIRELGPALLRHGVLLERAEAAALLGELAPGKPGPPGCGPVLLQLDLSPSEGR